MTHRDPIGISLPLLALFLVPVLGCSDTPSAERAPETPPLEAPDAVAAGSVAFAIERGSSEVDFLMEAPLENIHGVASGSVEGTLNINLSDIASSTGLVRVDLDRLDVLQRKRESADGAFGEEVRSQRQNDHLRTWLQISDDAPPEVRERHRWVEFRVDQLTELSVADVRAMSGPERTLTASVHGDLRLHGRTVRARARFELTFVFEGEAPSELRVRSLTPLPVSLEAHDVRPRRAFDQLAQKTLAAVGEKVAESAPVNLRFTARAAN